mgnify:CR=1 FL=1
MKKEKTSKKRLKEIKKEVLEKYIIAGLWQTMCGYIVLLFIKELLTDNYYTYYNLICQYFYSIFLYFVLIVNQYKLIKENRLSLKPFSFQIFGIIVGLFIVILTLKSPFDISFAILVIAFLTSKKMFEKELMK